MEITVVQRLLGHTSISTTVTYLHVRRELWAKVTRALFYDLVALGEEREVNGNAMFGVVSAGEFFAMAEASALREFA